VSIFVTVAVKVLVEHEGDPFVQTPFTWSHNPGTGNPVDPAWDGTPPITREEIKAAIEKGNLSDPVPTWRDLHISHIAYFAAGNAPKGLFTHLQIAVMTPTSNRLWKRGHGDQSDPEPKWHLTDGYHRLAAAIYRGDETVECELYGLDMELLQDGDQEYIEMALQVKLSESTNG
jgi:hypothetical protein